MSTTVPPRDGDRPAGSSPRSPLVDEEALRLAFLAEYPALSVEARTDLGADAAALGPKVVEGAFVRAWDARQRIASPDALRAFLVDDVHHAAARALSRRAAAHRFVGSDTHATTHAEHAATTGEVNPAESWQRILSAVHGEPHTQHALDEAAAISRHEAAEHIAGATKERSVWLVLGIGAVALAAVIAIGYLVDRAGADDSASSAVNASDARVVSSLAAQVGIVTLDDGTKVRLAPDSKLFIPKAFGGKLRAVKLEGAAAFDVAKGRDRDFRVLAGNSMIVAKGTAFTVRDYPADSAVTVVVTEGAVEVRQGKTVSPLQANSALVMRANAAPRIASAEERDAADAWRTGTLAITNLPLRDVLPQLSRWYGLYVTVVDTTLLARTVTLRASIDSSHQAIRAIEQSAKVEFGYQGQAMVFRDASTAAKKH
jgi:transmembrane sensor